MTPSHASATALPASITCPGCLAAEDAGVIVANAMVCSACAYHLRLNARQRLGTLVDPRTFREWDERLTAADPLRFVDAMPYPARIADAQRRTGERDAIVTGQATLRGRPTAIGVFEFGFMGGSMGSVVGEKLARLFARAGASRLPVIVVSASGGARMQEGTVALMQMAKVTLAVRDFRRQRLPYLSVLTDPTMGGVSASIAMLGDVILAEPGAQIGFAGPRVIEQTIRAPLPPGFQRAEHLLANGLIDAVVPRAELRARLEELLRALTPRPSRR